VRYSPLRPFFGGVIVASAVFAIGTTRYIGLGIPTIVESFAHPSRPWDFAAKFLFTAVTLGCGFKGGEVTPLFFIGATLGNALSYVLPLPVPLLAGMGFCAVFAGAANTPIASTLMAMELFGSEAGVYAGIACVVSYLFSGHSGIYGSQRVGMSKYSMAEEDEGVSLSMLSELHARKEFDPDIALHPSGFQAEFQRGTTQPAMTQITILRLYFSISATVPETRVWRRMAPRNLGHYLLRQAKEAGIHQAVLHRVSAGFLNGDRIAWDISESAPPKLPQCLELVADEEMLRVFLEVERPYLSSVRAVMMRSEDIVWESGKSDDPALESEDFRGPSGHSDSLEAQ
jgi:PII-like signaling protein